MNDTAQTININGLEVPKRKGCSVCNDPNCQAITDALLRGVSYADILKGLASKQFSDSTLQRHKRHLEQDSQPMEPKPTTLATYRLESPELSSDGVRLVALEEMILAAKRIRDICEITPNLKAEEAYLRALSLIETTARNIKFN